MVSKQLGVFKNFSNISGILEAKYKNFNIRKSIFTLQLLNGYFKNVI
jgi:hypothetical protein